MNNLKLTTFNATLTTRWQKMTLNIFVRKDGRRLDIRIQDAADHYHRNPYLKLIGTRNGLPRFTYNLGLCFGGQGADMPEFNAKLEALKKDDVFRLWYRDNIHPVLNTLVTL